MNSSTRVNAGASYFVAVDQPDFLVFGLSVEFLSPQSKGSTSATDVSQNFGREGIYSANTDNRAPYLVGSIDLVNPIDLVNSSNLYSSEPANPAVLLP